MKFSKLLIAPFRLAADATKAIYRDTKASQKGPSIKGSYGELKRIYAEKDYAKNYAALSDDIEGQARRTNPGLVHYPDHQPKAKGETVTLATTNLAPPSCD